MAEYITSPISPKDLRAQRQLINLLEKEGISKDKNLDYTIGVFDEEYRLAATGSVFACTLRCMAVDSSHQGEGLMNRVVSELVQYEYEKGYTNLYLYTKCDKAHIFADLGFYEVARVPNRVVFMENLKGGFEMYLKGLKAESEKAQPLGKRQGAVVMNANPFTLGHRHLVEKAAAACDLLHLFIVSEDVSLVPFSVREELVLAGTADIKNIVYHRTGDYMISSATFPSYFLKEEALVIDSHAALDIAVFSVLAKTLGITVRFVGEEPASQVTGIYNAVMQKGLAEAGIDCVVIKRKKFGDAPISASTVRRFLQQKDFEALSQLVPQTTLDYFRSEKADLVLRKIADAGDVAHY